jgi:hypothetical protein
VAVAVVGRDRTAIESQGGRAIEVAADCTVEADLERRRNQVQQFTLAI